MRARLDACWKQVYATASGEIYENGATSRLSGNIDDDESMFARIVYHRRSAWLRNLPVVILLRQAK